MACFIVLLSTNLRCASNSVRFENQVALRYLRTVQKYGKVQCAGDSI